MNVVWIRSARYAAIVMLGVALAACAGPVGTNRTDPKIVLHDLARSATTTGEPSWQTRNVLLEQGLFEEFGEHPEEVLGALHKTMVATGGDPNLLFALAELSFLHGQPAGKSGLSPGRRDLRLRLPVSGRKRRARRDASTLASASPRISTTGR